MSLEQNITFGLIMLTMSGSLRAYIVANRKLHALRRNAFVTNEKGRRVRYSEASAAVRAGAERNI